MSVCKALLHPPIHMRIGLTFDLDLRRTELNINNHLLIKDYLPTKFEASGAKCSWVTCCTRRGRQFTFNLDLWPTDQNITMDDLLIKVYLPIMFEAFWAKCSWVISCTMLRDTDIPKTNILTDWLTCAKQFVQIGGGGIKIYSPDKIH